MDDEKTKRLSCLLAEIAVELQSKFAEKNYSGIHKSINILSNRNVSGYKNINFYLMSDFRRIYDERNNSEYLDRLFDEACAISEEMR